MAANELFANVMTSGRKSYEDIEDKVKKVTHLPKRAASSKSDS